MGSAKQAEEPKSNDERTPAEASHEVHQNVQSQVEATTRRYHERRVDAVRGN